MPLPNMAGIGRDVGSLPPPTAIAVVTGAPIHQIVAPTLGSFSVPIPPNAFAMLRIYWSLRLDVGAGTNLYIQFNGDSGLNYSYQQLMANGAAATAVVGSSVSQPLIAFIPGASTQAGMFGMGTIEIPNPQNPTVLKAYQSFSNSPTSNSSFRSYWMAGYWNNTAPLTSILFGSGNPAANFVAGGFVELSFA